MMLQPEFEAWLYGIAFPTTKVEESKAVVSNLSLPT